MTEQMKLDRYMIAKDGCIPDHGHSQSQHSISHSPLVSNRQHPYAALGVLLVVKVVRKLTIPPINARHPEPAMRSPMSVWLYLVRGPHTCDAGSGEL